MCHDRIWGEKEFCDRSVRRGKFRAGVDGEGKALARLGGGEEVGFSQDTPGVSLGVSLRTDTPDDSKLEEKRDLTRASVLSSMIFPHTRPPQF